MLTLPSSVRIFVCLAPADMRRSLDGLSATTREVLREDPLSVHLRGNCEKDTEFRDQIRFKNPPPPWPVSGVT